MSTKKRAPKKVPIDYKKGAIYKVVNDVNDMIYVGSTTTTLSRRFSTHKACKETDKFHEAIRAIGKEHFRIILIENYPCGSKVELVAREYEVMKTFSRESVYNANYAGDLDEESRQKLRERVGALNHQFGRGCICITGPTKWGFCWRQDGKQMRKTFCFAKKRTKEAAYMLCCDLRNEVFPLTNLDLLQELPFV